MLSIKANISYEYLINIKICIKKLYSYNKIFCTNFSSYVRLYSKKIFEVNTFKLKVTIYPIYYFLQE